MWAYCYVAMVQDGELLAPWGRTINRYLHGEDYPPDPALLTGLRYALYKYTYCTFCLAGAMAFVAATAWCLSAHTLLPLATLPPIAMITTQLLTAWTK
jgi:hypothetical protein